MPPVEDEPQQRRFIRARDNPNIFKMVLYAIQQVMVCASALLTVPLLQAEAMCPSEDLLPVVRNELISTTFFSSGISTLFQTLFGVRLALMQGTSYAYIPSVQNFMYVHYGCGSSNISASIPWEKKLAVLQGSLAVSTIIPIFIGATGLVGVITKHIGPLTVSSLMILLAESQVEGIVGKLGQHWVGQCLVLLLAVLYLSEIQFPLPVFHEGKFSIRKVAVIGQYPYLIGIVFTWLLCLLLTITNLLPIDSPARLDRPTSLSAIRGSKWAELPYPGKYGTPVVSADLTLAFILSAFTSIFESVGDYHTAARVSEESAPPSHAINRGIMAEGAGSLFSALFGPALGMTTRTENIGVMGVTRVASRSVMVVAGLILIALGVCTKIGAILSTIPEALVGGILASSMTMVCGVAVQNLRLVDMNLPRNMSIFGFSIMFGLIIPRYFEVYPVNTGWNWLDTLLTSLLKLQMFVGALIALILDTTVGGATRKQRGLADEHEENNNNRNGVIDVYDFPKIIMKILAKVQLVPSRTFFQIPGANRIPFLPRVKSFKKVGPIPPVSIHVEDYDAHCPPSPTGSHGSR